MFLFTFFLLLLRDNDFEVAKMDYYRRRNSTVESMRETSQRLDVDLLQNFVVQTRRASLPSADFGMPPPALILDDGDRSEHADMH